ncbi:MAG: tolR [Gammaproteobacteria bacterium]|jgi:biopolymer transport protein TolR|nr:tolR [Gammaproteobacteria bacterium]
MPSPLTSSRQTRRRPIAEINVVPYIDVMLVLLIIFMVTTPLLSQGVEVELPKTQARSISTENKEPIIVSIDSNGHFYLNIADTPSLSLEPEEIAKRVAAEIKLAQKRHTKRLVLVRGDNKVNYGYVVQVMALLQRSGVDNVGLMTDGGNMAARDKATKKT